MDFYPKYVVLCNNRGVSPSKAAVDIGLSKTAAHGWKNGSTPTDATKAKLEEYFGVAAGYFSEENEKAPTLSGEDSEFNSIFNQLNGQNKKIALAQLKALLDNQ